MRVLALDFDGVLSDSAHEVFTVAARTWLAIEPAGHLTPRLEAVLGRGTRDPDHRDLVARFLDLIPLGNRAEDFGVALAAIERGRPIADQQAYDAFRVGLEAEWLAAFHSRFYDERERLRHEDPQAWVAMQRPYRPFLDLLRRHAGEVELAVATAKDRESVAILTAAYGVADLLPDDRVWDKEAGRSKREHLEAIASHFGVAPGEVTFVDDKLNHLESARPLGVRGVLAAWGFNGEREISAARREGFEVATLATAEEILFGVRKDVDPAPPREPERRHA